MIVGNGDIAKILNDRKGALFFASGVSNSGCLDSSQFKREKNLLLSQPKDLCLFYFSTISLDYVVTPYTIHKAGMELLIKSNWNHYNIIRLGNILWGTNPNTFINFLRNKKAAGQPYELRDEYRYVVAVDQLLLLTDNLPLKGQNEISIFTKIVKPKDII